MLANVGTLMNPRRGGVVALPTIQALSALYDSESTAYFTAAGITDEAQKFAIDYVFKFWKTSPWFARWKAATNTGIYLTCAGAKSVALVNMVHPGTRDLTEVGTITFAAFDGVSTSGTSNYLESGIPLNGLAQNSQTIGGFCTSNNAGATGAYDMGATAAAATATKMMVKTVTTSVMAGAVSSTTVGTIGTSSDHSLPGPRSLRRLVAGSYDTFNFGVKRVNQATASAAIATAETIAFLVSKGATAASQQSWGMLWIGDGLSDEEYANLCAGAVILTNMFRRRSSPPATATPPPPMTWWSMGRAAPASSPPMNASAKVFRSASSAIT